MRGNKKPRILLGYMHFFCLAQGRKNYRHDDMDGIAFIVSQNKADQNIIITSSITLTELLQGKIDKQKEDLFQECLKRPNLIMIGPDSPIAYEARRIRDHYYLQYNKSGRTVATPDALHLATAIIYGVDEFHTLDGKNKRKQLGLLPLTGNVAGVDLKICKPSCPEFTTDATESGPKQREMDFKQKHRNQVRERLAHQW